MSNYIDLPVQGGGSGAGVSSINSQTGALTLVGAGNTTVSTVGQTITISSTGGGSGTVTSVALVDSTGLFTITGSPVTTSGSLTLSALASQSANTFLAAPNGAVGAPSFRLIVASDIPTLNQNTTGTASNITAASNTSITSLPALSLPYSQVTSPPAAITALTGDISASGPGSATATLPSVNTTGAGTYGSATQVPVVTLDAKGRVTSVTNTTITAGTSSPLTTKGDLYGYSTTNARLPVGADGTVLMADSTQSLGVKWGASGGTGTVTNASVVSANGLAGTVANSTTTPAITLSTTVTGVLKGNGTAISAATAGTDYVVPSGSVANFTGSLVGDVSGTQGATSVNKINGTSLAGLATGLLKNTTTTGAPSIATAGTDYVLPSGSITGTASNVTGTVAVVNGGTGKTSVTTAPTATSFAGWDANSNFAANMYSRGFATTVTVAGTTTLTVASNQHQQFTGTTTQTVVLPDATTLPQTGASYIIANRSTGIVTVNTNGGATLQAIPAGSQVTLTASSIATSAGTWDYTVPSSGGSTSPGGSSGQVQYNNSGLFGGASNVGIESGGHLSLTAVAATAATPSASASGKMTLYGRKRAGRTIVSWIDENNDSTQIQPHLAFNSVRTSRAIGGLAAPSSNGLNIFTTGTNTGVSSATTNLFTSAPKTSYVSAATAGSVTAWRHGNSSGYPFMFGQVGYYCVIRFGIITTAATQATFTGLETPTTAIGTGDPSTVNNRIGIGAATTDTNLQIIVRGTVAATKVDLGANFPATGTANTDFYELRLYQPPGVSQIYYYVERLNTGDKADGVVTTNLPALTTGLVPVGQISNETTATAVSYGFVSVYVETDY